MKANTEETVMIVTHNNYRRNSAKETRRVINTLQVNESTEGETIEQQIERMVSNKEPIKDGAKLIYTERTDGVKPEMNVRTDRFEIAIEATSKIQKSYSARREERHKPKEETEGGAQPIQGTSEPKKTA